MQVACPHCRQVLEFADRRPAFCGFCGGSLADVSIDLATTQAPVEVDVHEAPTQAYMAEDADSRTTFFSATADHSDSVGDYKLLRQLGQGGMGVVYEAEQAATGRHVALKLLSPKLAHTHESMERFVREGRLAAAFSHPRSTFVFGAGQHAGQPYITMELMPGRTLNDVCHDEGRLPVNRAVDYILDVIEGLEAAHAAGIIHRDVKPSNCFLDGDGRVKVGDFGLSKSLVSDADLTRTGAFLGTPLFAAPEQVRAGQIDKRTDIYSVGATLFYLIAGRGPFHGDPAAVIAQIASDPAPPLRSLAPAVPKDLDQVVARTLEKDPARRFANLAQFRQALLPFATGGTVPALVGRRLGAYFVDTLVTGVSTGFLFGILFFIAIVKREILTDIDFVDPSGFHLTALQLPLMIACTIAFALVVSYFAICESWTGKSLGKRLLGLRVVRLDGGRPGIGQAFLRAALVPGLMLLSAAVLVPFRLPFDLVDSGIYFDLHRMLIQQLLGPLALVPMLACLVTMRARNGYSGLHDRISGTRVVQIRPAAGGSRSSDVPIIVPRAVNCDTGPFGPFRVMGSLGTNGNDAILQARDEALHRLVWILVRPVAHPVAHPGENSRVHAGRAGVARATRPRWLQGGICGPSRWDAFEAVVGTPLRLVVSQAEKHDWERGRFLLLDLAEELVAASADGTLPAALTLDQVWVDRDGRMKLLDTAIESLGTSVLKKRDRHVAAAQCSAISDCSEPVPVFQQGDRHLPAPDYPGDSYVPLGASPLFQQAAGASKSPSETFSPAGLMRAAAQLFRSPQTLPCHAQVFLAELMRRPDGNETLVWAAAQLRESLARTASLKWSDRLVAVGVSMGTEYSFYQIPIALVMLAMLKLPAITEPIRLAALFLFALAMPAAAGFWTLGGPVFRLLGIDVRRSDGQPAGRGRCAWRNLVAWMPVMLACSLNVAVLPRLMKTTQAETATFSALASPRDYAQSLVVPLISLAGGFASLIHAAGACYAVARPQRGIQDLLAGTRLVPR